MTKLSISDVTEYVEKNISVFHEKRMSLPAAERRGIL
jgi:hypothetical protein